MREHASKAIEMKILSYLLEYPDQQHEYMPQLSVDDFYHHKEIFKLYKKLYNEEKLNSATVFSRTDGEISDIMRTSVSPTQIESLYDNLCDKADRRRLFKLTKEIQGVIESEDSVKGQISSIEQELGDIIDNVYSKGSLVSFEDLSEDLVTHLYELRQTEGNIGISTGLGDIDRLVNGYEDGEYILIAARPRVGKTDFMLQSALQAAKDGKKTGIFTLEMLGKDLMKRMLAQESGVNRQKIRRGTYNENEGDRLNSTISNLKSIPLMIDDNSQKIDQLVYIIQREVKKDNLDIAFIDYLGLVGTRDFFKDKRQQKEYISQRLKFLAQDIDIPLVCLVQLNRNVEHRDDPIPRLSDLRQTGQLEQDADIVLFLSRPGLYKSDVDSSVAKVKVGKQRNGPEGLINAIYNDTTGRFNCAKD